MSAMNGKYKKQTTPSNMEFFKYPMERIDYNKTNEYWNQDLAKKILGQYSAGYVMPAELEDIARFRFINELNFLNQYGKFGGNYLDLGCGTGNFILAWHKKFDQLIGIDFSTQLVNLAQKQVYGIPNTKIIQDNVLNFERHIANMNFKFIFLGGCFMYLNDSDVTSLITRLFHYLDTDGIIIFREPTATRERIAEKNIGIRRTIAEYKNLINLDKYKYGLNYYQNFSVNYTHFIGLYIKIFPFIMNHIDFFSRRLVALFLLFLPVKIYSCLKNNMVLYHFFIIKKKS
jgi:SAM-dependent methyltransferase